ncbi:MAG: ethanolamine utilization protein EutH [Bacilli bacterium]|nr:ethanolamine utilization protein EutH [Bacilli bacterium]
MIFSLIIVSIMMVFALIGIIDIIFLHNKLGLGNEFKKGFDLVGPLILGITGIICFVPVIANFLNLTITPLYKALNLDPSMAVTAILAMDMGGFQLAKEIAFDSLIGEWAGVVYGSMMGATIVFSIPVGLATIRKEDVTYFARGTLFGIAAIPFGTFIGGLMMGIDFMIIIVNLIIPCLLSLIIILCLLFIPKITIKIFKGFSVFVNGFSLIALFIAIVKDLIIIPFTNIGLLNIGENSFINMINSTTEGILISGQIGLVLCGTLPFVAVLMKMVKKPLKVMSVKTGISEIGLTSFLITSASSMGMLPYIEKMENKEKVMNIAFATCSAWVIGDHLAFCATNAPHLIAPMMVAKLSSGVLAIIMAYLFSRKL